MGAVPIRIVVGEGRAQRAGLLRFVLEGEGFDVVRVASSISTLATYLTQDFPDVVVVDDGLGTGVASMVRRLLPSVRIVLVWPAGLTAIAGDACLEPADVFRDLGRTVRRVVLAKPPVEAGGRAQRADRRAHPSTGMVGSSGSQVLPLTRERAATVDRASGSVVVLPVMRRPAREDDDVIVLPDAADGPYCADDDPVPDGAAASGLRPSSGRAGSGRLVGIWLAFRPRRRTGYRRARRVQGNAGQQRR